MAEIPQLKEASPILSGVDIKSGAEGYEAFAKTLGNLSQTAAEGAKTMASEESQTMYINSVANIEQLKSGSEMMMLQNPGEAAKINQKTREMMDEVKNNAYVNKGDRTKLNAYISGANDDVALKATRTEVTQGQHEAAFTHYANWPDQLKAYKQALLTDHDQAETLKQAMLTSLHSLVSTGALTPEQAGTSIKTMSGIIDSAKNEYDMMGNPNATAKDYQTSQADPFNRGTDNTGTPVNASTGWIVDYHNNDRSFQGVMADISNRVMPSLQTFDSLKPNQQLRAIQAKNGVQIADGMINSGEPFPAIEKEAQRLSESGRVLSYREQATRNALNHYISDLKNGNYLNVMAQTPIGNGIMKDFVSRDAAIKNAGGIDNDKKMQMLMQNKNKLVDESVAYGQGHHIPSEYIQPIPQADIAVVENAFKIGEDPSAPLQILSQYSKQNQIYVASALKDPGQRMIVNAVALAGNDVKPADLTDFIAANQKGREDPSKELKDAPKDKALMTNIAAKLSPAIRMIGANYDFQQAQGLQSAMLSTTLKYAKYLAQKDNNIDSADKYIDQAVKIYANSFQKQSGTNWIVNPKQLPEPLSNAELDILADHVTNEGYKYLRKNLNESGYMSATDRNPLKMVISPTNDVQAVDGNGKVYFTMPFTSNVMAYAHESKKKRDAEFNSSRTHDIDVAQEVFFMKRADDANAK